MNDFEDMIEHLENALTASYHKMEIKVNNIIEAKIEEEIFELGEEII